MDNLHFIYPFLADDGIQVDLYTNPEDDEPVGGTAFSFEFLVDELFSQVANEDGAITAEDDREFAEDIAQSLLDARNRIVIALNQGKQ